MLKRIDKYLILSFIGPFILTFLIVTFALMLQFLWLYIDELVGKGLGLSIIVEFLGWGSATLIPLALPIATLLASIMTLGSLGENNELLAIKASGVPLQRVLRPLIVLSFIISIGAFFASNNLIPVAYANIYSLRDDINRTKEEIRLPTGTFYNGIDGLVLRIAERDEKSGTIYGVMLYSHRERQGNVSLTIADSGSIHFTPNRENLLFTLYNGYTYEEDPRPYGSTDTSFTFRRVGFKFQEMLFPLSNYAFQRSDEERFKKEIMSQNLSQLKVVKDSLNRVYEGAKSQQLNQLIYSSGLIFNRELDSAFIKRYEGAIEYDSLFNWSSQPQLREGLISVQEKLKGAISLINSYQVEEEQHLTPLRKTKIERFRKFTLSIACFIFFFIGAPLGAIIRKGGLGTPVIVSMLFFILYWVVDISGKKLATDGVITPAMGTLISSMILFPIGIYLTYKSTTDSSLLTAEGYNKFFTKALKLIKFKR